MKELIKHIKTLLTGYLRNKLILLFTSVIVISFSIVGIFSYGILAKNLEESYVNNTSIQLGMLSFRTDDYFETLKNASNTFYSDVIFSPLNYANTPNVYNYKLMKLQGMFIQRPETHSVLLYLPENSELYVINDKIGKSFYNAKQTEDIPWYARAISKNSFVIEPAHKMEGYNKDYYIDDSRPVFSINRKLEVNGKLFGVLSVNYRIEAINNMLKDSLSSKLTNLYLFNKEGQLLSYAPDDEIDDTLSLFFSAEENRFENILNYTDKAGEKLLVLSKQTEKGHILIQSVPVNIVLQQANSLGYGIVKIGLVCIIFSLFAIISISIKMTKPLKQVENCMNQIALGNFNVEIPSYGEDEIGHIAKTCNYMKNKINVLVNQEYLMKIKYKDAQISALQAQINPHFISNALQCIGSSAFDAGAVEAEKMTRSLSNMLRYGIKGDNYSVLLSDEIKNTSDYLKIQKFRFEERLEYIFSIDENTENIIVPKLILQPIVENAIIHGAELKKGTTTINISFVMSDGIGLLEIRDDGIGMPPSTMDKINEYFKRYNPSYEDQKEHIGIANVYSRLVLMFENSFSMELSQNKPQGVIVSLKIPLNNH